MLRGRPLRVTHVKSSGKTAKYKAPANASAAGAMVVDHRCTRNCCSTRCNGHSCQRFLQASRFVTLQCPRNLPATGVLVPLQVQDRQDTANQRQQQQRPISCRAAQSTRRGWALAQKGTQSGGRRGSASVRVAPRPLARPKPLGRSSGSSAHPSQRAKPFALPPERPWHAREGRTAVCVLYHSVEGPQTECISTGICHVRSPRQKGR